MAGLLSDLAPSTYPNVLPPKRPSKPKMAHGTWTFLITLETLSRSWRMIGKLALGTFNLHPELPRLEATLQPLEASRTEAQAVR